jgi:hypothetical protein
MHWSETGRFDDPLIRIIMGSLWAMCGYWDEARVDFRVASDLAPSLKSCRELADMDRQPANLVMVLGGPGSEPVWDPELNPNLFRGARSIKFVPRGNKSAISLKDSANTSVSMNITPDSSNWYKRHFIRDNEIQDLVQDSKYGQSLVTTAVKGTVISLGGLAIGITIATGGIAVGGAIIAWGVYIGSGELAAVGFIPLIYGPVQGYYFARKSFSTSYDMSKRDLDVSEKYRFVRFLPEYAWLGWSGRDLKFPITVYKGNKSVLTFDKNSKNTTSVKIVSIGFIPDTK